MKQSIERPNSVNREEFVMELNQEQALLYTNEVQANDTILMFQ